MKYNKYHNAKIYKIVNNVDDMVYIGSTCLSLSKRKYLHKTEQVADKSPNRRLFMHTKKYGWDEFDIYLVEQFSCHNKESSVSERSLIASRYHATSASTCVEHSLQQRTRSLSTCRAASGAETLTTTTCASSSKDPAPYRIASSGK